MPMKKWTFLCVPLLCLGMFTRGQDLRVVLIRHAEKPAKGDNLTCQGLNRALALPKVLYAKFGTPDFTYVPALGLGNATKRARMFQTVTPMAVRYNLTVNSSLEEKDSTAIGSELLSRKGTVLVVWEHKAIPMIARALGVKEAGLTWNDDDFDSIWIITFPGGKPTLTKDKEGLQPAAACPE